jgi:Fe2+ or Zn2+ uptake regulation protein
MQPLRHTPQRQAVLRIIKVTETSLSPMEIVRRTKKIVPGISAGTVYRNIDQLVKSGEIFRLDGEDGPEYIGHAYHHATFRCQRCGKERELQSATLPKYVDAKMFGKQKIFTSQLIAQGLCGTCDRTK